ncbi:MAG: hypothetical protein DMF04_06075 [Verrucomicrobia bacterium]|nr:MAG: hypothetical protein DMF04_06075 [Verrucomicrobiota bacterium]
MLPEENGLSAEETSVELTSDLELEIGHILLIDVVGYSTLLVNEQIELLQQLNQIVRSTQSFHRAEAAGRLTRLPTGDGMALLFFGSPEEPAQCALAVSAAIQAHPHIKLRMGVHSGPVNRVTDVNDRLNVAGPGINVAQRVMDCGDAGHILLSRHVADDLEQYRHWKPYLHDLGECVVKHGLRLHLVNLFKDNVGNPDLPHKLRRRSRWRFAGAPVHQIPTLQRGLLITLLLGAATVAGFLMFSNRQKSNFARAIAEASQVSPVAIPDKSIAVLPFKNLSDDRENAFFTDGVQDEIVTDLAKVADLKVISRTSVMQYRDTTSRNIRQIGKELGVAHVLEGSVQRVGGIVRVTAQLIDARTDGHLWSDHYDRNVADVFAIETELAKQIVSQLKATLSTEEKAAIEEGPTRDLKAYDLYLRAENLIDAIAFSAQGKENLFEAIRLLDSTVARDPTFVRAYCQLARAHDQIYFLGFDHTPARLALAESAIQAILRLRPNGGEAHLALAQHLYWGYRDYTHAREELAIARRDLPNEPLSPLLTGYIDRREGRWDDSIREMEHALDLDPRNIFILQQISLTYANLRRHSDRAAVLDRVLTILPQDANTRMQRALVDLDWRADLQPLRSAITWVATENRGAIPEVADYWRLLALCDRNPVTAGQALANTSLEGSEEGGVYCPKAWWEGLVARTFNDNAGAHAAFARARVEIDKIVREQPDYAQPLSLLGMIDAGLSRKQDAIREGKRATELLLLSKDALGSTALIENLAVIYAWVDEKALACDQLELLANIPSGVRYGQLCLHPYWDSLRKNPRFEKIVASLAPK